MSAGANRISFRHREPIVGIAADREWQGFSISGSSPSIYHSIEWAKLIKDVFGHEAYCLCVKRTGDGAQEISGILPLIHMRSWIFGSMLVSLPFCNWGGPVAGRADDARRLILKAEALAKQLGVNRLELRSDSDLETELPVRRHKVRMILKLPRTDDELLTSLSSKVRSQTRRPVREGATFRIGAADAISQFYSVFSRNMRDLGTPVLPKKFFSCLFRTFSGRAHVVTVEMNSIIVAAAILLENGARMEIPWASSLREANRYGVNMLLYLESILYAIRRGFAIFDFGRSSLDSGTYRFKKQWGARPEQLYWYTWDKEGRGGGPGLSPDNPKFNLAIKAWQKLPLWIANQAGPHLAKSLP